MNRISEYYSLIDKKSNLPYKSTKKDTFYNSLYNNLENMRNSLKKKKKYVDVLVLEEKYTKLLAEMQLLFKAISIESNNDEKLHFEGVKAILNLKLNQTNKLIKIAKKESMKLKIELEPEMYKPVKKENHETNLQMEEENKKILQKYADTSIQATRRRVVEIQEIQNLIGMHIEAQDERIDNVKVDTKKAQEHIKLSKKYVGKGQGRIIRRFLSIFILCLSFVLLFLYFHHRK
ncbi:hypothetical protein BDAP_000115 [Binucleata daphniae]